LILVDDNRVRSGSGDLYASLIGTRFRPAFNGIESSSFERNLKASRNILTFEIFCRITERQDGERRQNSNDDKNDNGLDQ